MRASLVSATSLLALLLLEGHEAAASPILAATAAAPDPFVLANTLDAGIDAIAPVGTGDTYIFTPLTTGVVSTSNLLGGSNPYWADQSSFMSLASSAVDPIRSAGYRRGADSAGNSVFVGTSGNLLLLDSPLGSAQTASASFGYTFSPTGGAAGTVAPADVGNADIPTITITNPQNRDAATDSQISRTSPPSPDGYTYRPLGRPATGAMPARGSAPELKPKGSEPAQTFIGTVPGATVFDTQSAVANGLPPPTVPKIPSSKPPAYLLRAFDRMLEEAPADANDENSGFKSLTATGYNMPGLAAGAFTVSLPSTGSAAGLDINVPEPILVLATSVGELSSSLMIFTAASTQLDGDGVSFTFFFDGAVLQ